MLRFLQQVVQNGSFILFLVLQFICFYCIISFNQDQKKIYLYSTQKLNANVSSKFKNIADYFNLKNQNRNLAEENAVPQILDSVLLNTIENFSVIPANIITNSINRPNNLFTINKGSRNGVLPNMGVITTKGVAGIVTDTSENFSLVLSVLNNNCKISAKLNRCGFFGPMVWNGQNPLYSTLVDIQKYADVKKGDTVSTSGFSYIFPPKIPIGIVEDFESKPGAFTYNIDVKLFQDMSTADQVYVIYNSTMNERIKLESNSIKYE